MNLTVETDTANLSEEVTAQMVESIGRAVKSSKEERTRSGEAVNLPKEGIMRKRFGVVFTEDGKFRYMYAVVVGEMADGSKVWMECDEDKNIIDEHTQYALFTRQNWSVFKVLAVD